VRRRITRFLILWCLAAGGGAVAQEDAGARWRSLAGQAGQKQPILRIGLSHAHRVSVSGSRSFRILDPETGKSLWQPEFNGEIQVVADGGPLEGVPAVYRVQVGAFHDRSAAEQEVERLSRLTGVSGVVHHDPDRGNWRVRLGRADDRLALGPLLDELRQAGLQGLWIAEEPAEVAGNVTLRLVDDSYDSFPTGLTRLAVVPTGGGRVAVQDREYRGLIELRISPFGTVRPVNWVELEQYLLGVVPAELGPEVWPELAALQAQAVAARTYAWRNRGQFGDEGFDLCDTPRCQVYKGADAEHPLSDRAVWTTRAEVLTWKGDAIVALYTATCGGHTEDGREIFPEHDEPYLRGVPCRAEADAVATLGSVVAGRRTRAVTDETGADVTRDWALLSVAGVVAAKGAKPDAAGRPVDADRLRTWTGALARLAGLPEPTGATPGGVDTLGGAAVALLDELGWSERARVLLDTEDFAAILRDAETESLDPRERRALAYLASVEGIRPFPDGRFRPNRPATRARLAPALVRIGESYRAFGLQSAVVSGVGPGGIRLVKGKGAIKLPVSLQVALFGRSGGRAAPVEELELWPGDRVQYRTNPTGAIDFLELQPPVKGTSDDRTAKVYAWEVRKSRRVLEAAVNRRVAIGRLKDLEVVRRGVSGRIVELRVVGSKATTVVRGFDVRRLLDLRESLLVIEPQRDHDGEIEAVVFAGKGWGHGVGLCQVGAYGMALRGADYRAILAHYYTDAKIERLVARRP
jgi:stage II sporulation protein D